MNAKNTLSYRSRCLILPLAVLLLFACNGTPKHENNQSNPTSPAVQQAVYTPQDREIFNKYLSYITPFLASPREQSNESLILEKTAFFFLHTPYVEHTLEQKGNERIVVNLRGLDCFTYVETVIALTHTVLSAQPSFETYIAKLENLRYRGGVVEGYTSRLHYTCDWVYDNEQRGNLCNISASLGGIIEHKKIDFMTTHRDAYTQLKDNDELWKKMQAVERAIQARGGFYYLPKEKIASVAERIPNMSVVCFTTNINGLDVTHVGFALWQDSRLTFIHASSKGKEVMVNPTSLAEYCTSRKSCTGIIVVQVL